MTAEDLAEQRRRRLQAVDDLGTAIAALVHAGRAPLDAVAQIARTEVQLISTDSLVDYLASKGLIDRIEYEGFVVEALERRVASHRARLAAGGAENFIEQLKKGAGL